MKPLVIGATGFLGLNITRALRERGYAPRCTRRASSNTLFLRKLRPDMVEASLDDEDSLRRAMEGCDTVFLAAGHYPRFSVELERQVDVAVGGVRNVISAARASGVVRLIYTGSVTTVDWRMPEDMVLTEEQVAEEAPPGAVYFAVKQAMEQEILAGRGSGLSVVALCPTGCLGEFDVRVGTGFLLVGLARGLINMLPEGRINMVDAAEVAQAHVTAAEVTEPQPRYLLGGHNTTVWELTRSICLRYGLKRPRWRIPLPMAELLADKDEERARRDPSRRQLLPREFVDMLRFGRHIDCTLAQRELGLKTPPLRDTIDRAWGWFARFGYLGARFKPARRKRRSSSSKQSAGQS